MAKNTFRYGETAKKVAQPCGQEETFRRWLREAHEVHGNLGICFGLILLDAVCRGNQTSLLICTGRGVSDLTVQALNVLGNDPMVLSWLRLRS